MKEEIVTWFTRLETLATEELHRMAENLVKAEQESAACLIAHLSEISKRKAHIELGYGNLYDYCKRRLGLSEGSTHLRVQVAKVCRRIPLVLERLGENRISLTVAGILAPHLDETNAEKLLSDCERMTKRQVNEYLVRLKPKPEVKSMIRKRPSGDGRQSGEAAERKMEEAGREQGSGADGGDLFSLAEASQAKEPLKIPGKTPEREPARSRLEPARPESYNVSFSASRGFKEKLERLAEVLGIQRPESRLQEVLEKALDLALEQKDPQKRLARRLKRENSKKGKVSPRPAEVKCVGAKSFDDGKGETQVSKARQVAGSAGEKTPSVEVKRSRYIPDPIQERVLHRAGYQCEYRGPTGVRCEERTGLEMEHQSAFGKGGKSDEKNLRVYCRSHNLWKAEIDYGEEFIRRKIEGSGNAGSDRVS